MARHTRLSLLLTALVVFCTRVEALSAASAQVVAAQSGGSESVIDYRAPAEFFDEGVGAGSMNSSSA